MVLSKALNMAVVKQHVDLLHLVMQQIFDTELVTNLVNRNPFQTRNKHWCWSQVCDWGIALNA